MAAMVQFIYPKYSKHFSKIANIFSKQIALSVHKRCITFIWVFIVLGIHNFGYGVTKLRALGAVIIVGFVVLT